MKTVSDESALRFDSLTNDQKKELSKMIDNWVNDPRTIFDVIHEISAHAKKKGLTQEILNQLLKDE